MSEHSITNLRAVYITNTPYQYPLPWYKGKSGSIDYAGDFGSVINTGWHILPNFLWGHVASPKQWYEIVQKYEAISVTGIKCRLFNPIPIQTALGFQAQSTFPAFNNTVYALGYTDDLYETPWFDWWCKPYISETKQSDQFYEWNPVYKEGFIHQPRSGEFTAPSSASGRVNYDSNADRYPVDYQTSTAKTTTLWEQTNAMRRQFLPIYWFQQTYKQYRNSYAVTSDWNALSSNFEFAWSDPSGIFWDPLNRPEELMELRPGKNMIEYSWTRHESDSGIWFNTDRVAALTPYGRPKPIDVQPGSWNTTGMKIRRTDPRGPGNFVNKRKYLYNYALLREGEQETVAMDIMSPESHMGIPDWRRWPIVPTRWFYKELQAQNPYSFNDFTHRIYRDEQTGCPTINANSTKAGDVEIVGPFAETKFPGTEYEMYKYPPTQWFIKAVPLFDDLEKAIKVEMQMFMQTTISLVGKPRRSAYYAPTWGPYEPMNLYSVNMDTPFQENFIRTRSAGARRTWYNPQDQEPWMDNTPPQLTSLYPRDGGGESQQVVTPYIGKDVCTPGDSAPPRPCKPISHSYSTNLLRISVTRSGKRRVTESSSSVSDSD